MVKRDIFPGTDETNRFWASTSFVAVLIIFGLPLWWKTTEVHRVPLPYDRIKDFSSTKTIVGTHIVIFANDVHTAKEMAGVLEKTLSYEEMIKPYIQYQIIPNEMHHTVNFAVDDEEAMDAVSKFSVHQHNSIYLVQRKPLQQHVWVSNERVVFFRDLQASETLIEVLKKWIFQTHVLHSSVATNEADSSRRIRFGPGDVYNIVLSVVHPRPDLLDVKFDAVEAVEDYIGTFVDELHDLHNFTLKSQWLHLLEFDFQAKKVIDPSNEFGYHYAVSADRLPLILTTLESRAATRVTQDPTINLALYVLPCNMAPLKIYQNERPVNTPIQAFLSPKWGGVVFTHPSHTECVTPPGDGIPRHRPHVNPIMGTFLAQLRELLGIVKPEPIPNAYLTPLRSTSPRRWEIDALLRSRVVQQLSSAKLTLTSLAQLLGEISNIVINDDVGIAIHSSVADISDSTYYMQYGSLLEAYRYSRDAFLAAEFAFMDPTLLALLYFPDDQKYAIYIPLFLPIMFPVVLSLKNVVLLLFKKPDNRIKVKTD